MCIGNVLQSWLWVVQQTRGLRALVDVSIAERSGPILVASTTDGRGLAAMCSSTDCSHPASCAPLCRSYRHVSRLRERNFCATWLSAQMCTAMAVRAARWGRGTSQVWGQAKTARARHAPRAPSQARSQNDGCTALILRAGSRRAGCPTHVPSVTGSSSGLQALTCSTCPPCSPAAGMPGSVQEMDAETVWECSAPQPVLRRGNG